MQLCNAEVHVEVLGVVATVVVRHTFRNPTGQFFRFLYDVRPPTRAHLSRVEARVAGQWVMKSVAALKEIRTRTEEEEAAVKYTPGLWPHAQGSGCYLVLDAPPEEAEELFITYTYAQPLDVEMWNATQGLVIPCQVVCPGASEGDAGALPPDSALTLHLLDAQCTAQLRSHPLKEIRCGEGRKYAAALSGTARHLLLQFDAVIEHHPLAILQPYASPHLPAHLSDPLSSGRQGSRAREDWPVASMLTFCPVLPKATPDSSVFFLLDCSAEASLRLFCQAISQALHWLPPTCSFNVVVMQAAPRCLFSASQKADSEHISLAMHFLQSLQPIPSTNIHDALAVALEGIRSPVEQDLCLLDELSALSLPENLPATALTELFLFLGSPVPDLEDCCALLASHAHHARLFATAHGQLADGQAAKELSRAAHGLFELPDGKDWGIVKLANTLQGWMELVSQPSCVTVNVDWEAPFAQLHAPSTPVVLFHHQPCTLLFLHQVAPAVLAQLSPGQPLCTITAHCGAGNVQTWQCTISSVAPTGYAVHTLAAAQAMYSLQTVDAQAMALQFALHSPWTCLAAQFRDEAASATSSQTQQQQPGSGTASPVPDDAAEMEEEEDIEDDANAGRDNPLDALKDIQQDEDLYEVLGVSPTATTSEIRKQFKRLAVQHHPDKNPGDEAALFKFQEILRAYEILQDEERRALYDAYGVTRPNVKIVFKPQSPQSAAKTKANHPKAPPKPSVKKPNRSSTATGMRPGPAPRALICDQPPPASRSSCGLTSSESDNETCSSSTRLCSVADSAADNPSQDPVILWKLKDVRCRARFALEKVAHGYVGNVNVNIRRLCNSCRGTGNQLRGWTLAQCPKCLGVGRVARLHFAGDGAVVQEVGVVPCSGCQGDGYVLLQKPAFNCAACKGIGYRSYSVHLNLSLGAGMQEDEQLVLKGFLGSTSPLLLPGDAVITVQITASLPFQLDGLNVHAPLEVPLPTALCGGEVEVPVLGAPQPLVLPVPERLLTLLPNMEVCLPFHGLPRFRHPNTRGHLILHCAILFPAKLPQLVRERLAGTFPSGVGVNPTSTLGEERTVPGSDEKENIPKSTLNSAGGAASQDLLLAHTVKPHHTTNPAANQTVSGIPSTRLATTTVFRVHLNGATEVNNKHN